MVNKNFYNHIQYGNTINDCWEWKGSMSFDGYGVSESKRVHRLIYQLYFGEISKGFVVNHLCENRSCCNPNHLKAVTVKENINYSLYKRKGENSTKSKLNNEKVKEIQNLLENTDMKRSHIAKKYNVNSGTIHDIYAGVTWNNITGYPKNKKDRKKYTIEEITKYFYQRILMTDNNVECWKWVGSVDTKGYGKMINGEFTHRFAYKLYKGDILEGLVINHLCKNIWCVNPIHLESVTISDNVIYSLPDHVYTRLSENKIEQIKDLLLNTNKFQSVISRELDVTQYSVYQVNRKYNIRKKKFITQEKEEEALYYLNNSNISFNEICEKIGDITFNQLAHISTKYKLPYRNYKRRLNREEVKEIKEKLLEGQMTQTKIAQLYNIHIMSINRIYKKLKKEEF